jgi:carbonic anhydrase
VRGDGRGSTLGSPEIKMTQANRNESLFPTDKFDDLLSENARFTASFEGQGLPGRAARGLAVVTWMDSPINPLALLGLQAGDVKILRNAGGRVTDDVLRTLVLATYLLNVHRVLVMPHTDCMMASSTELQIHETILAESGVDTRSLEFRVIKDQKTALTYDVTRIRAFPLLQPKVVVGGAVYNVRTGQLEPMDI